MKTIKIKYIGFWEGFCPEKDLIYQMLMKHYTVHLTDEADYVICGIFGEPYEYCKYPQVRIMYVGENYLPDFNLVDYAISRYSFELQDRHCDLPACLVLKLNRELLRMKKRDYPDDTVEQKKYFANFIASHESEYGIRGDFFKELCKYKRVESIGTYLNNMPNGEIVQWTDESKVRFQRQCKFTLCFESTAHEGFVTEKISDAFLADTIPIYYGSSTVVDIYNSKAFINCADYESFDDVIMKIIELDQDDEAYMKMLREPIFVDEQFIDNKMKNLEEFLCNIFEQPLEKAYRRSRIYWPKRYENWLLDKKDMSKALYELSIKKMLQSVFFNVVARGKKAITRVFERIV